MPCDASRPRSGASPALHDLADRLHSAAIHLLREVRREDAATGLTPARLSALSVVVFAGPLPLGELAAAEQVRPPTMSRLVAALEEDGLVRRRSEPADRRVTRVEATARGGRLLAAARQRRLGALADRLAALPAEELERLSAASETLAELFSGGGG